MKISALKWVGWRYISISLIDPEKRMDGANVRYRVSPAIVVELLSLQWYSSNDFIPGGIVATAE